MILCADQNMANFSAIPPAIKSDNI